MARRGKPHLGTLMETMGPPVSTTQWSPNFVAQTLEVLPVGLGVMLGSGCLLTFFIDFSQCLRARAGGASTYNYL